MALFQKAASTPQFQEIKLLEPQAFFGDIFSSL